MNFKSIAKGAFKALKLFDKAGKFIGSAEVLGATAKFGEGLKNNDRDKKVSDIKCEVELLQKQILDMEENILKMKKSYDKKLMIFAVAIALGITVAVLVAIFV